MYFSLTIGVVSFSLASSNFLVCFLIARDNDIAAAATADDDSEAKIGTPH